MQAVWDFKGEVIDLIVTIAWLIWYVHNVVVHETSMWYAGGIIDKAKGLLVEFRAAMILSRLVGIHLLLVCIKLTLMQLGLKIIMMLGLGW